MKKLLLATIFSIFLIADNFVIDNFDADIFKKDGKIITIKLALVLNGRYLNENRYKIMDSLNSIIGNFFYENLITSKGKITLKRTLKKYTTSTYSIDIDNVYIQKIHKIYNENLKEIKKDKNVAI